jgi:Ca2+-transporting ATPase
LVVIGIAGIKDPLRDGIKEAVIKCHKAGVTVRMVQILCNPGNWR